MKKLATLSLLAVGVIALSACAPTVKEYDGTEVQGVSATEILVGNTAATTGAYAPIGVPFNIGLEAALKVYNLAGGFNGAQVKLKHYDDGFNAANGLSYTTRLVEDDKVFALVGHFGTPTVGATINYIKDKGIPMVYGVTGINDLYQVGATGYHKAVMPVQPIYKTEGRVLLARALAPTTDGMGLGGSKIGVIIADDEAGLGMAEGVREQAKYSNAEIIYSETPAESTNHSAAVAKVKDCDVIIICANQGPFSSILNFMKTGNVNKPVITSYVSANGTLLGGLETSGAITADRPVYTNAWLDTSTTEGLADYMTFAGSIAVYYDDYTGAGLLDPESDVYKMALNSYAMAGYCAGMVFLQGLARVDALEQDLTWLNYINAMEAAPVDLPMGGQLDFANGDRLGIASLALNNFHGGALNVVNPVTSLDNIWTTVPTNLKK
jgi:ABC-type branched-subunit amino acid transport system substrate-binding protein